MAIALALIAGFNLLVVSAILIGNGAWSQVAIIWGAPIAFLFVIGFIGWLLERAARLIKR